MALMNVLNGGNVIALSHAIYSDDIGGGLASLWLWPIQCEERKDPLAIFPILSI